MTTKKILFVTQLSNYDTTGKFLLHCDSGWQMCMGRIREILKLSKETFVDITGPLRSQLDTQPEKITPDLFIDNRVRYIEMKIIPNALATRYDFDFEGVSHSLALYSHKTAITLRYDTVYLNDPLHLVNYKAMFHVKAGYQPRFVVHSHFIDNPEAPKFPIEASLWLGQCEAAIKADHNFWQCEAAMYQFFTSMSEQFLPHVVESVRAKSTPYDDGYSVAEISSYKINNVRFDIQHFKNVTKNKVVILVPNRIGGKGRSSDYTRCGQFMFDILPQLRNLREDFVVIAGNPSQKFSNQELADTCGKDGYFNLTIDAFNRDEYKFIARHSDVVVGLYGGQNGDMYGGTASRECIELGCLPIWCDFGSYSDIAKQANYPFICDDDLSNIASVFNDLIYHIKNCQMMRVESRYKKLLQDIVRNKCSYEQTTPKAMEHIFV